MIGRVNPEAALLKRGGGTKTLLADSQAVSSTRIALSRQEQSWGIGLLDENHRKALFLPSLPLVRTLVRVERRKCAAVCD